MNWLKHIKSVFILSPPQSFRLTHTDTQTDTHTHRRTHADTDRHGMCRSVFDGWPSGVQVKKLSSVATRFFVREDEWADAMRTLQDVLRSKSTETSPKASRGTRRTLLRLRVAVSGPSGADQGTVNLGCSAVCAGALVASRAHAVIKRPRSCCGGRERSSGALFRQPFRSRSGSIMLLEAMSDRGWWQDRSCT